MMKINREKKIFSANVFNFDLVLYWVWDIIIKISYKRKNLFKISYVPHKGKFLEIALLRFHLLIIFGEIPSSWGNSRLHTAIRGK